MGETEETLVARAKTGDFTAASHLVAASYGRVFAFLRRLTGHDDDAADLTQRTFMKVWNALPTFDGRARFNTWIHSIAHHVYVDWRRKARPIDERNDAWWEARPADGPSPFENAAERETAQQLYALVEQLEEEQRVAVHLHYFQELTLQETADALGLALSTLKYRLRGARDFLQLRMAEPKVRV